jgi:hypothetical protein
MADLAASAVTIERSWTEGGTNGLEVSCRQVTLVLTGQGGTTNKIPASVLALTKIEQSSVFVKSDDTKVYPATPDYAGANLLLNDLTQATDANRALPADITATVRGVVKGQE